MIIFKDLKTLEQSMLLRRFLKNQRFYKGLLEAEKDRLNIKDIEKQKYISSLQTHLDIMSLAIQDLEIIERYVIEQSYYEGLKHVIIAKILNCGVENVRKINTRALKKIRIKLCKMDIGITNKDILKKGMF